MATRSDATSLPVYPVAPNRTMRPDMMARGYVEGGESGKGRRPEVRRGPAVGPPEPLGRPGLAVARGPIVPLCPALCIARSRPGGPEPPTRRYGRPEAAPARCTHVLG